MYTSFTQLYVHLVWATWDRLPLITSAVEGQVYAAIAAKCRELKCAPLAIGGDVDHVHLLVQLHPMVAVGLLVREVKGSTSHLMTHKIAPGEFFKWQGTYGGFTLPQEDVPIVRRYIESQKVHHAAGGAGGVGAGDGRERRRSGAIETMVLPSGAAVCRVDRRCREGPGAEGPGYRRADPGRRGGPGAEGPGYRYKVGLRRLVGAAGHVREWGNHGR